MKNLIILIALCLALNCQAQFRVESSYRPVPKKGELVAVGGLLLIGVSSLKLIRNEAVNKSIGYVGGSIMVIGVKIDIGKKKTFKKPRHKRSKR